MAARDLIRAGRRVVILEASGRKGGRILTRHDPLAGVPVELGAEFVHGDAPLTTQLLDEARLTTVPVLGEQFRSDEGELSPQDEIWERMRRVFRYMNAERKEDRSFQEFLDTRPGGRALARERELAHGFVQGFNGAHTSLISEKSIAQQGDPTEGASDARRILEGYGALIDHLSSETNTRIRFGAAVRRVLWDSEGVRISDSRGRTYRARLAVFTTPLPTLHDESIQFEPDLPGVRKAARQLMMGQVTRVSVIVRERFWESRAEQLSFVHSPSRPFNVWWTQYPLNASVITGWSGGPPSIEMSQRGDVENTALSELARVFGVSRRRLDSLVEAVHTRDWGSDRNIRGAYSYAGVGGTMAPRTLARPVGNVLFFAGEATDSGSSGTVEGALASGRRAAKQVLVRLRG
jgi:monoamine oxidase